MNRVQAYLDAVEAALKASTAPKFLDVRVQLEAIDEEDITRQSFGTPAARVILLRGVPARNPDRSLDVDLAMGIAILARADKGISAEEAALDSTIGTLALIDNNRFGLTSISLPRDLQFRAALASTESKGLSVVVMTYQQRLLRVTEGVPMARGLVGPDGKALPPEEVRLPPDLAEFGA